MPTTSSSGSGPYTLIDRLADEFARRYRRGERPSLKEYIDRYPELADEIRELLPALARLEQAEEQLHCEAPDEAPEPALLQVGDFRIVREVGRGGMGVVYEAEQVSLGRRVALKILLPGATVDRTAMERFRREARAAARLQHANIVPVFEVGQEGDVSFYAMQFIRGQGLDAVIDQLRRLRGRSRHGRAESLVPRTLAPDAPVVGPMAGPTASRDETMSQVVRSLLTGQLAPAGRDAMADGSASSRGSRRAAALAPTEAAGPSGHGSGAAPSDASAGESPDPPGPGPVAVPASIPGPGMSAALPGGSQVSAVEAGDRSYFRSVAQIGRQAAQALAYAHARGVVHRDIKPSNLLLDTEGVVWISDFGLAKAEDDGLTRTGDILGTIRYMAPERFRGEGDGGADLYALGLTLYELLTLQPAFDSPDRLRLIEQIQSEEPTRPRALDPRIPRDLETIVAKATDKDPLRRYASADALAEDLRRFLDGEPIWARQVSETEKLWKWVKRRPALASSLALLALSMVAGTAVSTAFAIRANDNAARADDRAAAARAAQKEGQVAQRRAERAERSALLQASGLQLDRGLELAEAGEVGSGLLWMLEALRSAPQDAEALRRAIRTNLAAWHRRAPRLRFLIPGDSAIQWIAIRPDGSMIATGHADDRARRWDPETGGPIGEPLGEPGEKPWISPVSFSADGAILHVSHRRGVRRYDAETGAPIGEPWGHPRWPESGPVLVRPDGGLALITSQGNNRATYLDPRTGDRLDATGRPQVVAPGSSRFLADGRFLHVGQRKVSVWDPELRRRLLGPWDHEPGKVWASHDGASYFVRDRDGWIQQFDPASGRPVGKATRSKPGQVTPVWSPDGRVALYQSASRLWGFRPAIPAAPDPSRSLQESSIAIAPSGRWVATPRPDGLVVAEVGDDWTNAVDQPLDGLEPRDAPRRHPLSRCVFSPDRSLVLVSGLLVGEDAVAVTLRETASGRPIGPGLRFPRDAYALRFPVAFSPDGRLAAAAVGMTVRVFEARTGRPVGPPLRHVNTVGALAFSPDGKTLAAGDYAHVVILWDTVTGRPSRTPLPQPNIVLDVGFNSDGQLLVVGTAADSPGRPVARLWDLATGRPVGDDLPHTSAVGARFSPGGTVALTSGHDSLQLLDAATGRPIGELLRFPGETLAGPHIAATSAFVGEDRAVVGSSTGTIRLLDAGTGRPIPGKVMHHPGGSAVRSLAVGPDRRTVLTGHEDGTARLWDLETARPLGPSIRSCRKVGAVAFSPDGREALVTSEHGRTWRWPVPEPTDAEVESLALRLELDTGLRLDPGPTVVTLTAAGWRERAGRARVAGEAAPATLEDRVTDAEWHAFRALEAEDAGGIETALWHLERLARLCPDDACVAARVGALHAAAGRFDRAASALDRAEALAGVEEVMAWRHAFAAECLSARRFETARWHLDRILARVPDDARALADRGAVGAMLGDAPGAEADLGRAAILADDPDLLAALGDRLARAGRWPEARTAFARASAVGPLTAMDRNRAAIAMLLAGDEAAFRGLVDRLLADLDPSPTSATVIFQNGWLGLLGPTTPEQAGRLAGLLDEAVVRLGERPDAPAGRTHVILLASGAALHRAGRHADAVARLEEGLAAEDGKVTPQDDAFLAIAHHALGHRDKALQHLDSLASSEPSGDFWEDLQRRLLRREAEAAIRLDPAFPVHPFAGD